MALVGCGIFRRAVGVQIEVSGAQRTLEEQILGSFEQVAEEVFLLAGVRSIDPLTGEPSAPPPMTESRRRALQARRRMEFNRDDILMFKRRGYAGEANDARLTIFEEAVELLAEPQPRLSQLVHELAAEENEDRATIVARIVETTPELTGATGESEVRRILASRYRQEAAPGMRVQLPNGDWVTVSGGAGR